MNATINQETIASAVQLDWHLAQKGELQWHKVCHQLSVLQLFCIDVLDDLEDPIRDDLHTLWLIALDRC